MNKSLTFLVLLSVLSAACGQPAKPPEPSPTPTSLPTPTPEAPAVLLTYEDNAQVELVTPAGRHIYMDVTDPSMLVKQPTTEDILLTTHLHTDHYYKDFAAAFPGQQILASTGKIELPDVTITGIAAGHNAGDALLDKGGTNYIYLIQTGGLRLAHFGDIGQDAMTADQLAALGSVDVAVMQFDNSFSDMNASNMKGFNLMDQVKPRLIIPSAHVSKPTIEIAFKRWTGYYAKSRTIPITKAGLPGETGVLVLGNMAVAYNNLYHLQLWK